MVTLADIKTQLDRIEARLAGVDPGWDPEVFSDPREWQGESFKGRKFSECPADYLKMSAEMYERFAVKSDRDGDKTKDGKPAGDFKRKLAAAARIWATKSASEPF